MRITTKNGTILNPRFLRGIQFDDDPASVKAIGEDGLAYEIAGDLADQWEREELRRTFDPVIPGAGLLLVASWYSGLSCEPTLTGRGERLLVGERVATSPRG